MKVVIGAGMAGIGAGLGLLSKGEAFIVLERHEKVGGLAGSIRVGDWVFDHTGHFLHFRDNQVCELLSTITELNAVVRRAAVAFDGRFVPYPFQQNLWALGAEQALDMVMGAVDAWCNRSHEIATFEDWILASVGPQIADAFMIPYNRKLYGVDPKLLAAEQGGSYIPRPDLRQIIRGALAPSGDGVGYNATFYYPKSGTIQGVAEALARPIRERILLGEKVVKINATHCEVWCASGIRLRYDPPLFSTIPLPVLATLIEAEDLQNQLRLEEIRRLSRSLRATRILNINVGIKGGVGLPYHWIYVPDERQPFYRVGVYSNVAPGCCPDGCSSVWAEVNAGTGPSAPGTQIDRDLLTRVLAGLASLGVVHPDACIDEVYVDDIWPGYVLLQPGDREKVADILSSFLSMGVVSVGRYGRWTYMSMEDSFLEGLGAAGCSPADIVALFEAEKGPRGEGH